MTGVDLMRAESGPAHAASVSDAKISTSSVESQPSAPASVDCVVIEAALAVANRVCQHHWLTPLTTVQVGRVLEFGHQIRGVDMIVIVGLELRLVAAIVEFIGVLQRRARPSVDRQQRGPRTSTNAGGHRYPGRYCRPAVAV
jgi:hypothetical protein